MLMCVCGHPKDEHGNDPEYPGSTACQHTTTCDCIAFELDEEASEDSD